MSEYLALDAVSRSDLVTIGQKTPLEYQWEKKNPRESDAMTLGTAVHVAVLEPDRLRDVVAIEPTAAEFGVGPGGGITKAGRAARDDWRAAHQGKCIVTIEQNNKLLRVRDAVRGMKGLRKIVEDGLAEESCLWVDEETGERCKARLDYLNTDKGYVVDLKTTSKGLSDRALQNSVATFGYDVQYVMQRDGANATIGAGTVRAGMWLFVQVEEPIMARALWVREWVNRGEALYHEYLAKYHACREADTWPGYGTKVQPLALPRWADNYEREELPF